MDSAQNTYTEEEQESLAQHLNDKYQNALNQEHGDDALVTNTRNTLKFAAPQIAAEMVYLALHGSKETTRQKACQYILDKILPDAKLGTESFAEALLKFSSQQVD